MGYNVEIVEATGGTLDILDIAPPWWADASASRILMEDGSPIMLEMGWLELVLES